MMLDRPKITPREPWGESQSAAELAGKEMFQAEAVTPTLGQKEASKQAEQRGLRAMHTLRP